ncbi:MAG: hypothetical protein R3B40_11055 [Polyangiales bacterium]|nr:hypothetical protein [Myxococcales bacterium]
MSRGSAGRVRPPDVCLPSVMRSRGNPAVQQAWSDAIGFIATTMIAGAKREREAQARQAAQPSA